MKTELLLLKGQLSLMRPQADARGINFDLHAARIAWFRKEVPYEELEQNIGATHVNNPPDCEH